MADQIKTPVIYLYDVNRALLATNLEAHGVGIVDFKYKFDDEDDDICTIKLQSSNIEMLELIQKDFSFETGVRLLVKWGYLEGPLNSLQTVVIRDVKTKYGSNIIWTDLECSDLVTYIKTTKSQDSGSLTLLQYLESQSFNRYNVAIVEHGKLIYMRKLGKTVEVPAPNEPAYKLIDPDAGVPPPRNWQADFDTGIEMTGYVTPKGASDKIDSPDFKFPIPQYKVTFNEETIEVDDYMGVWLGETEGKLYKHFTTEFPIMGANRSPFIVIRDRLKACPDGPWYVTGRGNTLLIHNRNLGGKPFRYYKYMSDPPNLIDFTFTSKYDSFAKRSVTFAGMSPLEKTVHYLDNYIEWLQSHRNIKDILNDRLISRKEMKKELMDWFRVYTTSYLKWKTTSALYALLSNGGEVRLKEKEFDETYEQKFIDGQIVGMTRRPDGAVRYEILPQQQYNDPNLGLWGLEPVSAFSYIYSSPTESIAEAQEVLASANRKLEMDKEEGKIVLRGDPSLVSEITVNITNVQKFQLGNYYVKKCEHRIAKQGFKVTLDTFRVIEQAKLKGFHTILEGDDQGLMTSKERYMTESKIFRNWDINIYKQAETNTSASGMDLTTGSSFTGGIKGASRFNVIKDVQNMEQANTLVDELVKDARLADKSFRITEKNPNVQDF